MNPEQQRIAIAEACGWKNADHPDAMKLKQGWTMPEKWCMDPNGVLQFNHKRPDYLNDLNAMHEAEKVLTADQARAYDKEQQKIGFRERLAGAFWMWHLPANWKAEAFLRTIGKWEEAK